MMESRLVRVTATGVVASGESNLGAFVLSADPAAAATLVVRDGGASGTIIASLTAPAGETIPFPATGRTFVQNLHATLTGASASATFEV